MTEKEFEEMRGKYVDIGGENPDFPMLDASLFKEMEMNYISESERLFFDEMKRRESECQSVAGDLLVSDKDNPDHVCVYRSHYCEFWVDTYDSIQKKYLGNHEHFFSLYEVLHNRIGPPGSKTLWQWLRDTDYQYVNYERDNGT